MEDRLLDLMKDRKRSWELLSRLILKRRDGQWRQKSYHLACNSMWRLKQYPDAFLLFRMGDFYELFYEDAVNAAQILEISLTSRNKNADNPDSYGGCPYHSAQQYIDVLIEQGYKVAIAEQMENPKQAVGVVKREVVQVITPGTVVDSSKPDSQNNFFGCHRPRRQSIWPSLYGSGDG